MCNVRWHLIFSCGGFFFKCAVGKIKNTEGSAISDGLLVVQLQYGLYVFGQVSMFVNAFQFIFCRSACPKNGRLTIGYNM